MTAPDHSVIPAATWSVVSMMCGRREYVEDFVQHFLALGAHEIFVFFDDDAVDYVEGLPRSDRVRYRICDAPYWARLEGSRPPMPSLRQSANVRHVFTATEAQWLLHVDLDERLDPRLLLRAVAAGVIERRYVKRPDPA